MKHARSSGRRYARSPHPIITPHFVVALSIVLLALGAVFTGWAGKIKGFGGSDRVTAQGAVEGGRDGSASVRLKEEPLDGGRPAGGTSSGATGDALSGAFFEAMRNKVGSELGRRSPFDGPFAPLFKQGSTQDSGATDDSGIQDQNGLIIPVEGEDGASLQAASSAKPHLFPFALARTKGPSVAVSGNGPFDVRDASNNGLVLVLGKNSIARVYYRAGIYTVKAGKKLFAVSKPIRFVARNGTILSLPDHKDKNWDGSVRYNAFRGHIQVVYSAKSKALWAVNELPIEDYLKGIAEADPKAPMEYLKTMAVVSRSYALFYVKAGGKHKGEPFDLHNSRLGNGNDQVYAGYSLEKRMPTVAKSVDATKGIVVTYKGAVAKTPYFAGSDGRTRSAAEVWGVTSLPYCRSVSDPYGKISNWNTLKGNHMVGLSGAGARGYARRGNDYRFILTHYYTGVQLKVEQAPRWIRIGIYKRAK